MLRKAHETIEVIEGREERRDFLIERGYELVDTVEKIAAPTAEPALPPVEVEETKPGKAFDKLPATKPIVLSQDSDSLEEDEEIGADDIPAWLKADPEDED